MIFDTIPYIMSNPFLYHQGTHTKPNTTSLNLSEPKSIILKEANLQASFKFHNQMFILFEEDME